ncbi:circumsporozoite protein [Lasius niger]|uniref:Circumsporozoite protein n=1 Tax=Lasius niger TaxID=67767 RepID=A0A0J7NI52_LASNI|nr:circumsporozoite protein [Lasius niger]
MLKSYCLRFFMCHGLSSPSPGALRQRSGASSPSPGALRQRFGASSPSPGALRQRSGASSPSPGAIRLITGALPPLPGAKRPRSDDKRPRSGDKRPGSWAKHLAPGTTLPRPNTGALPPNKRPKATPPAIAASTPYVPPASTGTATRGGAPTPVPDTTYSEPELDLHPSSPIILSSADESPTRPRTPRIRSVVSVPWRLPPWALPQQCTVGTQTDEVPVATANSQGTQTNEGPAKTSHDQWTQTRKRGGQRKYVPLDYLTRTNVKYCKNM